MTNKSLDFFRWDQVLLIGISVLLLESVGWLLPVQNLTYGYVVKPMKHWWVQQSTKVTSTVGLVSKLFNAAAHIQDLESRLADAAASLTELDSLKTENKELRYLLENTDRPQGRTLITRPVVAFAKPAVAGGLDLQLEKNSLILSRETLLGQISEVGNFESQVTLLYEKEATPILAETDTGVQGIVRGDGRKLLFTEVARTANLIVGQRVITVGQPQVEQGILIGKIVAIENNMTASVQTAVIEQYVSFYESPVVEVR
ncbi:MAG: hypothetical protein AUK08_01990 [Candidatus Pacebacteria bacterium CG2_30_36_39]|nr:hypothetical protein [Candidatus Pacearchaeota archaeon]OIP74006.1 MAG: hypothetical protein AUK08_01990 [Candidatus Pacebacteria bacterium CG2_30_36_39]